jgi:type 1 glutamine amidotransferase
MGQAADKPAKIRVLLITGDDVDVHPWRVTTAAVRETLGATGKFDVKVCEDPLILESQAALKTYDVIYFNIFARSLPDLPQQAQQNLLDFVKGGKGFFAQHLASASFPHWEEFGKLCGRRWVMGTSGHGPRSVFEARIVDHEHPITRGLEDFSADDELYAKLQGDGPIHVLVEAHSDWSKKTEPLLFCVQYGKGRVVHSAFGHDGKALANPTVQKFITRGVQWAALGKVSEEK